MIVLGGWAKWTGQYALRMSISIRSVKLQDRYTVPYYNSPIKNKQSRV